MKLGEKIGRSIRADYATSITSRGKFARMCVKVDFLKKLLPKFRLKNRIRKIEYEGLYLVCFKCGIYGHREEVFGYNDGKDGGMNKDNGVGGPS